MSKTTNKFASEVRARTVRMIFEHERSTRAPGSGGFDLGQVGCSVYTLHEWVKMAEVNSDKRADVPAEGADKVIALEHEVSELRTDMAA